MRIYRHSGPLPPEARGAVAAIGNFDGVHLGHQAVIGETAAIAARTGHPRAVVTFEPHPRRYFKPDLPPFRLTPLRIKAHCIEALGVDHLFVLHFDKALASLTPADFVAQVLAEGLATSHVVVGEDFIFGKARAGNAAVLQELGDKHGFGVTALAPVKGPSGEVYSSTRIRDHLTSGRPAEAAALLGRVWEIEGRVVPGDARGRDLGYPTANIDIGEYLRPRQGIYAVCAGIDRGTETHWHDAVASFGTRPAIGGGPEVFEVHLLDHDEDLYGKHLRVGLVDYLRPESDFDSLDALRAAIARDVDKARAVLAERAGTIRFAERPGPGLDSAAS